MKCRTVLAVLAIALVPILAGAQEENQTTRTSAAISPSKYRKCSWRRRSSRAEPFRSSRYRTGSSAPSVRQASGPGSAPEAAAARRGR